MGRSEVEECSRAAVLDASHARLVEAHGAGGVDQQVDPGGPGEAVRPFRKPLQVERQPAYAGRRIDRRAARGEEQFVSGGEQRREQVPPDETSRAYQQNTHAFLQNRRRPVKSISLAFQSGLLTISTATAMKLAAPSRAMTKPTLISRRVCSPSAAPAVSAAPAWCWTRARRPARTSQKMH